MFLKHMFEAGKMTKIGKAVEALPYDPAEEDHFQAARETGFYGRQGAGAIIMARDTGRFLLGFRSDMVMEPRCWGTFGGAIDAGEDPMEATQREINQETGYTGRVEMERLYVFTKGTFRYSNFLAIVDREFKPRLNWEHTSAKWFDLDSPPRPLHFGVETLFGDPASMKKMQAAAAKAKG